MVDSPSPAEAAAAANLTPAAVTAPEPSPAPTASPPSISAPSAIPVQVRIATARASGYSWDEINQHLAEQQQKAFDVGYAPREVDRQLGYQDPRPLQDRLAATARRDAVINAPITVTIAADQPIPQQLRATYADAVVTGEAKGPQDFSAAYDAAGATPIEGLVDRLPNHQDLTDHAIALLHDADLPQDPDMAQAVKANILDRWAAIGRMPAQTYQEAVLDPILRDKLTRLPPVASPPLSMAAIERIESGGNPEIVSPAGAVGLYQVTPATARALGFDPAKLTDPIYNTMVAREVMRRNAAMFPGDTEAQLIAYNAGPGRAEAFLKGGRDLASLPGETINYLRKYAGIVGSDAYSEAKRLFDPIKDAVSSAWQSISSTVRRNLSTPEAQMRMQGVGQNLLFSGDTGPIGGGEGMAAAGAGATIAGIGALTLGRAARTEEEEAAVHQSVGQWLRGKLIPGQAALATPEQAAITQATQGQIRYETGWARRGAAQDAAQLEQYRNAVNQHLPEFQSWLGLSPDVRAANEPYLGKPLIANLYDYMEGRSSGATLDPNSPFAPVADAIRDSSNRMRREIEASLPDYNSFYEDYIRHMWADPHAADQVFLGGGRMGSNASIKMRSIPTIADGLAQGLVPKILDPIDNQIHYVQGMQNFLAQNNVLRWGRDQGYVKYSLSGAPEEGWEALKGRGAEKPVPIGEGAAGITRAYAPVGFARSYNNWVGKGFYESPVAGPIYSKIQQASNALTAWKLGLSAYHAGTMTKEALVGGLASGLGDIAAGLGRADLPQVWNGLQNVGLTAMVAPRVGQQLLRGSRLTRTYLGTPDVAGVLAKADDWLHMDTSDLDEIANLYTAAGGRVASRGQEYQIGTGANWFKAWKNGALSQSFQKDWGGHPVGSFLSTIGDGLSTLSAPLFDWAIPRIKFANFADEMQTFLRANPTADFATKTAYARRLTNAMDDRYGEMVLDNVFWPRAIKQALNAATISVGWNFGTARMVGTGLREIGAGLSGDWSRLLSPEARVLYAYPAIMALTASVYQYLKTGTTPFQTNTPWLDIAAPRTGGTYTLGSQKTHVTVPERAQLPGYDKDFDNIYFDIANAPNKIMALGNLTTNLVNKLNPMFGGLGRLVVTQKNYFGEPVIAHTDLWEGLADYAKAVGLELAPIAIEQQLEGRRQAGSNIGMLENLVGPRTAPSSLLDPERAKHVAYNVWLRGVKEKEGFEQLQQQRAAGNAAAPPVAPAPGPALAAPTAPELAPTATPEQMTRRSHHKR